MCFLIVYWFLLHFCYDDAENTRKNNIFRAPEALEIRAGPPDRPSPGTNHHPISRIDTILRQY